MANMNISSPTAAKIFAAWQRQGQSETPRTYLGASIIGHDCDAYLWLQFRGVVRENFDGRMYRLFDRGKREEAVFCEDLRRIGCEVREFDDKGNQFSVSACGGHFGGHLDGLVRGLDEAPKKWHVVEFKTHSDSSFRKLCKEGVKRAKPMHYAQMQTYMGLSHLDSALYMAVNKDNDDLWCERVKFDKDAFDIIMERAKRIIDTVSPDRCSSRPDDYRCKACPCASVCWHKSENFVDPTIPETCRTCCHATAVTDGDRAKWTCRLGHDCGTDKRCSSHLILPFFVSGEAVEGDEHSILFSFECDGKTDGIRVGRGGFSVEELKKFGPKEKRSVQAVKESVPEAKVVGTNDLKRKYEEAGYEVYFHGTEDEMMKWNEMEPVDFTKPIRTEEHDTATYFEYAGNWCVKCDAANGTFTVYGEQPPF